MTPVVFVPHVEERTALRALGDLYASVGSPAANARFTGFDALDAALGTGLRAGDLALVAGKPGIGKTIFCLQWARSLARRGGHVVHVCYDHAPGELVARLLQLELRERAIESASVGDDELVELTARLRDVAVGALHVAEVVDSHPLLAEAEQALASYGDRLVFLGGSGERTDVGDVEEAVRQLGHDDVTVFVDYIERIPAGDGSGDRVEAAVSSLKALAASARIGVVAVAAVEASGFTSGSLELHHLDRAATAAYEADLVLGMTTCSDHVCVRVVKHRTGAAGGSAALAPDFGHSRFAPASDRCEC